MADSIRKRIVADLVAALEAVTAANGYQTDLGLQVETVFDATSRFGTGRFGATVQPEGGTRRDAQEFASEVLQVQVVAWAALSRDPRTSQEPNGWDLIDALCSDVARALVVDPSRGGLAHDTRLVAWNWQPGEDDQATIWVTWSVQVDYDHRYEDPSLDPSEVPL